MKEPLYNNKRVIRTGRTKYIKLILISFVFVVLTLLMKYYGVWHDGEFSPQTDSILFWLIIILFGGGGLFLLIQLLNPKNLFVEPGSELDEEINAGLQKEQEKDTGLFVYHNHGFSFKNEGKEFTGEWAEIETIFGCNENPVEELLSINIFTAKETTLKVTELTPGWQQFVKRLYKAFPFMYKEWEAELLDPDFPRKRKLLFDKKKRSEKQAEAECYNS